MRVNLIASGPLLGSAPCVRASTLVDSQEHRRASLHTTHVTSCSCCGDVEFRALPQDDSVRGSTRSQWPADRVSRGARTVHPDPWRTVERYKPSTPFGVSPELRGRHDTRCRIKHKTRQRTTPLLQRTPQDDSVTNRREHSRGTFESPHESRPNERRSHNPGLRPPTLKKECA